MVPFFHVISLIRIHNSVCKIYSILQMRLGHQEAKTK